MVVLLEGPGLGVDFGIIYRVLDLQMPEIPAPEAFDKVEGIAVGAVGVRM